MWWGNTEVEKKVAILKCCRGFGGFFAFFFFLIWGSDNFMVGCQSFPVDFSGNVFYIIYLIVWVWETRCLAGILQLAHYFLYVYRSKSVVLSSQNVVPSLHQLQWFYSSSCVLRLSYFSSSPQLCLGPKYTPSALMKRWVSHTLSFALSHHL